MGLWFSTRGFVWPQRRRPKISGANTMADVLARRATDMKILLIGNYLSDGQESMQRFTTLMQEGLTVAGHEAKVIHPPEFVSRLSPGRNGLRKWLGYVDKFVIFPVMVPRRRAMGRHRTCLRSL